MSVLSAAVVLVGLIGLLNLVLSFGIIRRLRAQATDQHAHSSRPKPTIRPTTLEDGERVVAVDAVTIDGRTVELPFAGPSFVGFFSATCSSCKEQLIPFVVTAERQPAGVQVLAVVGGTDEEAAPYLAELLSGRSEVLIVREQEDGPIQKAFGIMGFPAFTILDDGVLHGSDFQVSALPDRP
ncbi:hypothetical protein OHA70_07255 [Kribbella sp. NBC_00382]|uniref:TlpA family protein disulfide reductase n=1 Tax=Kribbella sp. NBC_00382 TaxID=2975967 RepID=UPI002E1B081F